MLDLSNNNRDVNWHRLYQAGQRRVYLKKSEGMHFDDSKLSSFAAGARRAGLKVGKYHFGHPENSPVLEARHFCRGINLKKGDLKPCLDFEVGTPSAKWALEFLAEVKRITGVAPIIYSYPDFLSRAHFKRVPAPLWLASYSRNDGKEHPFVIPKPWKRVVAHQFSSRCTVAGCPDLVDISTVFSPRALEAK